MYERVFISYKVCLDLLAFASFRWFVLYIASQKNSESGKYFDASAGLL